MNPDGIYVCLTISPTRFTVNVCLIDQPMTVHGSRTIGIRLLVNQTGQL
jgi:hypothetical protein